MAGKTPQKMANARPGVGIKEAQEEASMALALVGQ